MDIVIVSGKLQAFVVKRPGDWMFDRVRVDKRVRIGDKLAAFNIDVSVPFQGRTAAIRLISYERISRTDKQAVSNFHSPDRIKDATTDNGATIK